MGTTKSKTVEKISYKSRYFPSLITINLTEPFDYPPRPRKTELNTQFDQILQEIQIINEEKSLLENFPKSLKWKLICRHRDFVVHNLKSIPEIDKSESQIIIEHLKETSSLQDLKDLNYWLSQVSSEAIQTFYEFSGLQVLIEILQVSELCSRTQGSFHKQIEILKAVLILVKNFNGSQEVMKIPRSISILFLNFNEIQLEVTGLMLEVMGFLLWETENDGRTLNAIFEAIERYKNENCLKERLDSFIRICQFSKNIMFIENILGFIITLISAPLDLDKRRALKAEFLACGIDAVLQTIKEKINKKEYKIEDCSYQAMKATLEKKINDQGNKFLAKTFTISEFANKEEKISDYEKYSTARLKNKNKNYLDDLTKFQTHSKLSVVNLENELKVDKTFAKALTVNNEKTYYLSETDGDLFDEHLKTVANQIEAFEKCEDEGGIKEKPIDFNNPLILFNELKDHAKKIESYPQLIMILQKLGAINQKHLFISLEEIVKYLKELSDQNPNFQVPSNFHKLLKDSQKFEELETKFEALQLLHVNQEKSLARLKLEKEKKQEETDNNNNEISTNKTIEITTNNNNEKTFEINTNILPPPPNILPPPLINAFKNAPPLNLLGPPAPNLLNMPGLPSINLLSAAKKPEIPIKEKKKPNIALKPLMWNTINAGNMKETIWEKIDDNKVSLDVEALEREFFLASKVKAPEKEEDIKKKEENVKVSLLPPEKSKNLEIVLGKLKLDFEVFRQALLSCEENSLSLNTLEALTSVIPAESEMKVIREYEGERETLANPEKFLSTLITIPGYFDRLNAIKFSRIYEEIIEDLETKLETLNRVWGGMKENEVLKSLFEYILAIGNYLNGTSIRGGAFGFKLDCLEKLSDLKTNNAKKNLLCYVIEKLEKDRGKRIIDENMDLGDYDLAAKLPISQLWTDLGEFRKGSKFVFAAIHQKSLEKEDKIEEKLGFLTLKLDKISKNFEQKITHCEGCYEASAIFLCENQKNSSEKLGEKIFKFWLACRNAKRILLKEEEAAKKLEENAAKEKEKTKILENKTGKIISPSKVLQKYDVAKDAKPFGMKPGEGSNHILEAIKNKRMSKILKIEEKK